MSEQQIESAGAIQSVPPFSETQLEQALADDRLVKGSAPSQETTEKDAQLAESEVQETRTKVHVGPMKAGAETSAVDASALPPEQQAMLKQMTTMQVRMQQRKRREFLAEILCGQYVELASAVLTEASGIVANKGADPKMRKAAYKLLQHDVLVYVDIALKAQQLMRPGNVFAEEAAPVRLAQPPTQQS